MSELLNTVQDSCRHAITLLTDISAAAPGTVTTQALAVGALVGFLAFQLMKTRYRLPPGPRPLPLLGNLLNFRGKEQLYITLYCWAKEKYGPIISIYFGPVLCVTLNDFASVNERRDNV